MNKLTDSDLRFVVARIPKDIRDLLIAQPFFVAGGFIRETIATAGVGAKDIDLFGPTKDSLVAQAAMLAQNRKAKFHQTDNACTLIKSGRVPVQFITRWTFDNGEDLLKSFDFTVCQAAIWHDGVWQSAVSPEFYPDLAARRLVYTNPVRDEEAGGSMMRVRKFLARGYNIQAASLGRVMARCVGKVRDFDGLDEEMRGRVIAGLLQEVDPMLVVDGFEVVDEDAPINT